MPIRYYINSELMPSEWEEPLLPGQVPITWKAEVVTMGTLALRASASESCHRVHKYREDL